VSVRNESFESLYTQLEKVRFRFDWLIRKKNRDNATALKKTKLSLSPIIADQPLKLCTYNINGLLQKRDDLVAYIAENNIDIIGIQETRRKADHWRLHIHGYNCLESTATIGPGQRGIAIAVKKGISCFPVGVQSPYYIFVRVFGQGVVKPFIVGTVYLPHRHANKGVGENPHIQARVNLIQELATLRQKYPNELITVMGDFNRGMEEMSALVKRLPGFTHKHLNGTVETQEGRRRWIDHYVVTTADSNLLQHARVDNTIDLSDHFPVLADLHYSVLPPKLVRKDKMKWRVPSAGPEKDRCIKMVYDNNRFAALFLEIEADVEGDEADVMIPSRMEVTRKVKLFNEACDAAGQGIGMLAVRKNNKQHPSSKEHVKAAKERRRLYCKYCEIKRTGSVEEIEQAFLAYKDLRRQTSKLARKARSDRWAKVAHQAAQDLHSKPKRFWSWMKVKTGWKERTNSDVLQPMRDTNGVLQTNGDEIREIWREHYMGLAADNTGHSQNADYWIPKIPDRNKPTLEGLNGDITSAEVIATLKELKKGKAPGPNQIPVEFLQLFAIPDFDPNKANKPLEVLTATLQSMWKSGFIPDTLNTASLVSIFKKDDPTLTGNYRGISLIDSLSKLLVSLLTQRLQVQFAENNVFIRGQAGCRPREESVAQSLALYETIKRRQNCGLDSYALFLDYQKAFDTVPHEGMFRKLDVLGVRGRMLTFIRALYSNSIVQVRSNDGLFSETFRLLRGVRQGCPMSPILFNLFINDMFDDCVHGATVPHKFSKARASFLGTPVKGLLFVDDAAALADTPQQLAASLASIVTWSDWNELTFNVEKCGLMHFSNKENAAPQEDTFANKAVWQIGEIAIPVVEKYTYLGLDFVRNLDVAAMVAPRVVKGRKAMFHFEPFFRCPSLPIGAKLAVLRSVVMATLLFGSEIWGMRVPHADPIQLLVNKALRWILNFKGPETLISVGAMHAELGLDPVRSQIATRRARAYIKFPTLDTWVGTLMRFPLRLRPKNWLTNTELWLNRNLKAAVGRSSTPGENRFNENVNGESIQRVRDYSCNSTRAIWIKSAPSLDDYYASAFAPIHKVPCAPYFGSGVLLVMLLRGNGYWLTPNLAKCKSFAKLAGNICPFCNGGTESASHLMLHCRKWKRLRRKYLGGLIVESRNAVLRIFGADGENYVEVDRLVVVLLLGGRVRGANLPNWLPSEAISVRDAITNFTDGDVDEVPLWQKCGLFRVAGFLKGVDSRRAQLFKEHVRLSDLQNDEESVVLPNCQGAHAHD
jgi:exonuclease III